MLAHYAGYFRSGANVFLSNARGIGDYWAAIPELDQGYVSVTPRHAGITGMVAGAVLDGRVNNWTLIRNKASAAIGASFSGGAILSSCDTDVREDAYGLSWLALAAMFDPVDTGSSTTPGQRSYWKAQLAKAYTRERLQRAEYRSRRRILTPTRTFQLTNGGSATGRHSYSAELVQCHIDRHDNRHPWEPHATGTGFTPDAHRRSC